MGASYPDGYAHAVTRRHATAAVAGAALLGAALLLAACQRSPMGQVGNDGQVVARGEGWAVSVPAGAKVVTSGTGLSVDAPDGARWFDVRLTAPTADLSEPPTNLALQACKPITWDEVHPQEGAWTAGGNCARNNRRYWVIARAEPRDDRLLVMLYLANQSFVSFEDAWVDFTRTAATLSAGPEPLAAPEAAVVRTRAREAFRAMPQSISPLPGGRTLSRLLVERLPEVWTARKNAEAPEAFPPGPAFVADGG